MTYIHNKTKLYACTCCWYHAAQLSWCQSSHAFIKDMKIDITEVCCILCRQV